jgi:hypothetical protein
MINENVLKAIQTEANYQSLCAIRGNWKSNKTAIEYAVLMEAEIAEAKQGFCKNDNSNFGRNTTEHEILQTVCLGLEFLGKLDEKEIQKLIDSTVAAVKHNFEVVTTAE